MQERFEIMEKAIEKMLAEKKYATLRDILVTMNPADIAAIFSNVEESGLPLLFRLLPRSWRQRPSWKWSRRSRSC